MFLLVWWWRPGGGEGDLQVVYDSINDLIVGDKGEYLHLGAYQVPDYQECEHLMSEETGQGGIIEDRHGVEVTIP